MSATYFHRLCRAVYSSPATGCPSNSMRAQNMREKARGSTKQMKEIEIEREHICCAISNKKKLNLDMRAGRGDVQICNESPQMDGGSQCTLP